MKWSKRKIVTYLVWPPRGVEARPRKVKTMKRAAGVARSLGQGAEIWRDIKRHNRDGTRSFYTEDVWFYRCDRP